MAAPATQLDTFLVRYSPELAALGRALLKKLRRRLPGAHEFVYDNYNALVIGFSPGEKSSQCVLSLALYPRWINLFFLHGAHLADPQKLLKGTGTQVRSITMKKEEDFTHPGVEPLLAQAIAASDPPFPQKGKGKLTIQAISPRQRPRRPAR